ncbi:MAG: hypothetical protein ACRCUI_12515 [Polymorphobacter sp.]
MAQAPQPHRNRWPAWLAIALGLLTLAVAAWFQAQPPAYCAGTSAAPSTDALTAFQMARTPEQLTAALGCPARIALLNTLNIVDLALLIPVYGAFLLVTGWVVARGLLRDIALGIIAAALIADIIETTTQLWIGLGWPGLHPLMLPLLTLGSTLKFAGLAIGTALLGLALLRQGFVNALFALIVIPTSLGSLLIFNGVNNAGLSLGVAWVTLLLALFVGLFRGRP